VNITLKEVPPELHERLKSAAEETGRSLNRQIIYTLEQALLPRCMDKGGLIRRIQKRRELLGGTLDPQILNGMIDGDRP
jgi:hypothetical protein